MEEVLNSPLAFPIRTSPAIQRILSSSHCGWIGASVLESVVITVSG